MTSRWCLGLVAIVAVTVSVGCSMANPKVRGQNPDNNGPIIGSAPAYGELKKTPYLGNHGHDFKALGGFRDQNFGYDGGFYAGPQGYYTNRQQPYTVNGANGGGCPADGTGCPECNNGQNCPPTGCRRCGCLGYHHGMPQHYQTQQYKWPQNQVYPTEGVPAGMVQYPYYTLRGPTDFFMK